MSPGKCHNNFERMIFKIIWRVDIPMKLLANECRGISLIISQRYPWFEWRFCVTRQQAITWIWDYMNLSQFDWDLCHHIMSLGHKCYCCKLVYNLWWRIRELFRHLCGKFTGDRWTPFLFQRDGGMWSFDIFFDVSLNKLLNKQSSYRWFHRSDFTVMLNNDA